LDGYDLITDLRKDRSDTTNGIGGGLLVYARKGLVILPSDEYNDFNQFLCFDVIIDNIKLHVILVYRPPSSNKSNLDKLSEIISKAPSNTFLFGDFNLPKINWNNLTSDSFSKDFMNACLDNNFSQFIDFPTHKHNNILDLVLSNDDSVLSVENLGPLSTSDHVMIMVKLKYNSKCEDKRDHYLNWNKADYEAMKRSLSVKDWVHLFSDKSVEDKWKILENELNNVVNKNVPKCQVKFSGRPAWMNQTLTRLKRKKVRYFKRMRQTGSVQHAQEYRQVTKELKRAVRKAKRRIEVKISKERGNEGKKKFNKYVKSKMKNKSEIGPLIREDKSVITDNKEMANKFNKYFASVFTKDNVGEEVEYENLNFNLELSDFDITDDDIEEAIDQLKVGKAPGPDGFSVLFNFDKKLEGGTNPNHENYLQGLTAEG
jgi:hypothetical protein